MLPMPASKRASKSRVAGQTLGNFQTLFSAGIGVAVQNKHPALFPSAPLSQQHDPTRGLANQLSFASLIWIVPKIF